MNSRPWPKSLETICTSLRHWIEVGYRRDVAWQGSLTAVIVVIMGLVLWLFFLYKGWLRSVQAWRGGSVHPFPRTCSERRPRPHQRSYEHGGTLLTKTE